ncbi:MAG: hypothetical protein HY736_25410 [Verrucomicrobia bacterium]|nr:hypothetical protein [Verrucomicrobiota bacterium]
MNRFPFTVFALLLLATAVRAQVEFSGILAMPGKTLFALTNTATSKTEWVALHDRFAGFVVTSYDRPTDTLTLLRNGTATRVRLKDDAKVQSLRFELTGTITFGTGEIIEIERATLLFDQENVFPLKDGIIYRITPTRRPDGTLMYRIVIEQQIAENRIDRLSAPTVITLPNQTFSIRIGEYGFSFTPKFP